MRVNLENDELQISDVEKHQSRIFIKSLLKRNNFVEKDGRWILKNAETRTISGIVDTLLKYDPELKVPPHIGLKHQEQKQRSDSKRTLLYK